MAPNRDAKDLNETLAVAVVKPVREVNVFRGWTLFEPVNTFWRLERIKKKARLKGRHVAAINVDVNIGVKNSPVINAGKNFIHDV